MIPVMILSARMSDIDKVLALGFGADDYMTKPFSASELVARVNAHLRRADYSAKQNKDEDCDIVIGDLIINQKSYTVTLNGKNM